MKTENNLYAGSRFWLTTCTLLFGVGLLVAMAPDFTVRQKPTGMLDENVVIRKDSTTSIKAFASVYKVLMSPRCMNCHPAGDVPLQGDDSHLHVMQPTRGKDGKGMYAMKCANCHQATNTPGLHTPPGNPHWHLPPADMKMVFQGKTPRQLARQLVDPKQNGHKDLRKLLEHVNDTLVIAGWHPGEGRTTPPLPYADFKRAWITWIENGAYAPKK